MLFFYFVDVLRLILEEEIATACRKFPLLVERIVLFALRCACEMIPQAPEYVRSESPEPGKVGLGNDVKVSFGDVTHVYPSSAMANKKTEEVWQCIGYLRNLPVEIVQIISGQISYGILHFIR